MIKYFGAGQDFFGVALSGVSVAVLDSLTGSFAALYEDDGVTPKANPVSTSSSGMYSFMISSGVYDITVFGTAPMIKVNIIEDASVVYRVNSGAPLVYGKAVYPSGDGTVALAGTTGTAEEARVFAICVDPTLATGSTGRFRHLGMINRTGTPGAVGYLGQDGLATETVPLYSAGDKFSTILGRQFSNSQFRARGVSGDGKGGGVGVSLELSTLVPVSVVAAFGAVSVNSEVRCMVRAGNLLYIGGAFTAVTDASGTVTRNRVACIDVSTALFTSWNPNSNALVNAMFSDHPTAPTNIYMCTQAVSDGTIGGVTARVSRAHPLTAVVDPGWVVTTPASNYVYCGLVIGATVYLGGGFTTLQGVTRYSAGAVAVSNAALQSWHPNNGDTVDTDDRIIQYAGSLIPGIATIQEFGGDILVSGGFYVRTAADLYDYLAVGWGIISSATGVFAQVRSGSADTGGGGCYYILAASNKFYVAHGQTGQNVISSWRELPEWHSPPAATYSTDKWAVLSSLGVPSVYPAYPNGGASGSVLYILEDPVSTDFFLLGTYDTAFGVVGADSMVRVTAAGTRNTSFAPVWGAGNNSINCGVRIGNALIIGGNIATTLNGVGKTNFTAVDAVTGANH